MLTRRNKFSLLVEVSICSYVIPCNHFAGSERDSHINFQWSSVPQRLFQWENSLKGNGQDVLICISVRLLLLEHILSSFFSASLVSRPLSLVVKDNILLWTH